MIYKILYILCVAGILYCTHNMIKILNGTYYRDKEIKEGNRRLTQCRKELEKACKEKIAEMDRKYQDEDEFNARIKIMESILNEEKTAIKDCSNWKEAVQKTDETIKKIKEIE